ncbi:MAG TPA: PEP/pyruvate-binding domain-containing protein [Candidatus Nanoarchaeia archaeon]|nr:PEP/pyruvate-binding domain-containing protein [Candidatus Nanoarchaeia archaeon]
MYIAWFKKLSKDSISIAGGKGAHLAELINARFPIPPGFVITAQAYQSFIERTKIKEKIQALLKNINVENTTQLQNTAQHVQQLILSTPVPKDIEEEISESYGLLGIERKSQAQAVMQGMEEFVAVRSSATAEDLPEASFAGQQATYLNVHGKNNIIKAVHACWASLFTSRAIFYRHKNNFPNDKVLIAVVIQRMVNSDASGVAFTINPATNDESEIIIEAALGLGELVVNGSITPDLYIIDKKTTDIKKHDVKEQGFMLVRDKSGNNVKMKIPLAQDKLQVLTDRQIQELARIAKKIEAHYNSPQDIEWAIEAEQIYIVQSRPVTTLKKESKQIKEIIVAEPKPIAVQPPKHIQEYHEPPHAVQIQPAHAIQSQHSHSGVPNDKVTATKIKVVLDFAKHAEKIAELADGVGLLRLELIIAHGETHPAEYIRQNKDDAYTHFLVQEISSVAHAFKDKPVWVRTSDIRTDEYRNLKGGNKEPDEADPMLGWHGIRRGLDEQRILQAELRAIKQLHDQGLKNLGIMIPFVTNADEVQKAKELCMSIGLYPQKDVKFGVMLETPAACIIAEELCRIGIDFISFGTNDLTQLTLGVDKNNKKTQKLFNEMHPSVLHLIAHGIAACKKHSVETSICGNAGSKPEMAEFLVKHGIDSISASPDALQKVRQTVAQAEKKLLLNSRR